MFLLQLVITNFIPPYNQHKVRHARLPSSRGAYQSSFTPPAQYTFQVCTFKIIHKRTPYFFKQLLNSHNRIGNLYMQIVSLAIYQYLVYLHFSMIVLSSVLPVTILSFSLSHTLFSKQLPNMAPTQCSCRVSNFDSSDFAASTSVTRQTL